jgi:hypothetical protein
VVTIHSGEQGGGPLELGVAQQEVVQTELHRRGVSSKAEANIQYIKSELEALADHGSLGEMAGLDPIQIALGESGVGDTGPGSLGDLSSLEQVTKIHKYRKIQFSPGGGRPRLAAGRRPEAARLARHHDAGGPRGSCDP